MKTFFFGRTNYNLLFALLHKDNFANALAYLVDNKIHEDLNIIPREYSIEISNHEITIAIILFVGFENEEYKKLKNCPNLHFISFSKSLLDMFEFQDLGVKYYDKLSWFFMIITLSKNKEISSLNRLKELDLH